MKALMLILILTLITGCASMSTEEKVWQSMHVIDVMQTYNGPASRPECFREADPFTKRIIGEHPSKESVVAWGIGSGLLFHWLAKKADESDNYYTKYGFYGFALLTKGITIGNNERIGMHFYGSDKCE